MLVHLEITHKPQQVIKIDFIGTALEKPFSGEYQSWHSIFQISYNMGYEMIEFRVYGLIIFFDLESYYMRKRDARDWNSYQYIF